MRGSRRCDRIDAAPAADSRGAEGSAVLQRSVDPREHLLEESVGEAPYEMAPGLTHEDRGKDAVGELRDRVRGAAGFIPQLRQRKPERGPDLLRVEEERLILFEMEGVRRHDHRCRCTGAARQIAQVTEILRMRELETHLLEGFAAGGRPRRIVMALEPAARKRHVPRPGIFRAHRTLDEEHLRTAEALAQHDGDRRIRGRGALHPGSAVSRQARTNEIDPHEVPA
jgi:hypothetical protein